MKRNRCAVAALALAAALVLSMPRPAHAAPAVSPNCANGTVYQVPEWPQYIDLPVAYTTVYPLAGVIYQAIPTQDGTDPPAPGSAGAEMVPPESQGYGNLTTTRWFYTGGGLGQLEVCPVVTPTPTDGSGGGGGPWPTGTPTQLPTGTPEPPPTFIPTGTPTPQPTDRPYPTQLPYPTQIPYPTQVPYPTALPTEVLGTLPTGLPVPTLAPCVTTPTSGPPNIGIIPDLRLYVPTHIPLTPVTVALTPLASDSLESIAQLRAQVQTPLAGVQTIADGYSWDTGATTAASWIDPMTPALAWLAVLNPASAAWDSGPLWAVSPIIGPVLPVVGVVFGFFFVKFALWALQWLLRFVDLIIKLIELIPGE